MLKNTINYYLAKHVSSQNLRLPVLANAMTEQEVVNVGVVDVDFATDLGEGDEALVARLFCRANTLASPLFLIIRSRMRSLMKWDGGRGREPMGAMGR